jgi:phosphopantothenoylcysteine decarboxylase/phosphopantothenate--cysteine ligase
MTRSAQAFITPMTFQALSGYPVHTELLNSDQENAMGHIQLARWADRLIVAPATANSIAKFSHGLADDLLSSLFLAINCPVFIAPAMNQAMWNKPITQENIARLMAYGITIIGPAAGEQACGDLGFGRMSEPAEICARLMDSFDAHSPQAEQNFLRGKRVLISAGPTYERLDPVRYISNRSSGKMGYALAQAAQRAGAEVTLVSGPVSLTAPKGITVIPVESAEQMHAAVMAHISGLDIYIGAAAVADYRPTEQPQQKIKKTSAQLTLTLQKTKDILADVAALEQAPFTVGFAAETDDLEHYAKNKLIEKKLDMIAANWVGHDQGGFASDQNALQVYWRNGGQSLAMADKTVIAEQLLRLVAQRLKEKQQVI